MPMRLIWHIQARQILRQIDYFKKYLGGLDKVYLEIHRGEHHVLLKNSGIYRAF